MACTWQGQGQAWQGRGRAWQGRVGAGMAG